MHKLIIKRSSDSGVPPRQNKGRPYSKQKFVVTWLLDRWLQVLGHHWLNYIDHETCRSGCDLAGHFEVGCVEGKQFTLWSPFHIPCWHISAANGHQYSQLPKDMSYYYDNLGNQLIWWALRGIFDPFSVRATSGHALISTLLTIFLVDRIMLSCCLQSRHFQLIITEMFRSVSIQLEW